MGVNEAIAELAKADRTEVLAALEKDAPGLHQAVFQKGYDNAHGKFKGDLATADGKVTGLTAEVTKLTGEVETLKKHPGTAELHTQYGNEIAALKNGHATEVAGLKGKIAEGDQKAITSTLRSLLTTGTKDSPKVLDADYAAVQLEKPEIKARIKLVDGGFQILQAGKDIPIAAQTTDAALAILAEELKTSAPSKFVMANTDVGGGNQQRLTPVTGAPNKVLADAIRESVKTGQAAQTISPLAPGPLKRLATTTQ